MSELPPEKYYEACITYHIVRYYEKKYSKKVLPFSISQREEHGKGYDFGYRLSLEELFYIQYKRPNEVRLTDGGFSWKISIEQLKIIIKEGLGECTYYALPGFCDIARWYEGLEETYFARADDLFTQLRLMKKTDRQSAVIDERAPVLKKFDDYFGRKRGFQNVLAEDEDQALYMALSPERVKMLSEEHIWGYLVCQEDS